MKIPFGLAISFILLALSTSFSGVAIAQSGYFVEGKAPSGELVKVPVNARPAPKYPRRAQRMVYKGLSFLLSM